MDKRQFKKLLIWQKAHQLTFGVYKLTSKFPKKEIYALASQIQRAAFSIAANIAEGCVKSKPTFLNHLSIAQGSLEEVKYYLILATDLEYITSSERDHYFEICEEIGKMIYAFMKKLKADS